MNDKELISLEEQISARKQELATKSIITDVKGEIDKQYEQEKKALQENVEFANISKEVVQRSAKANLAKDMLDVMTQEHKNELSAYVLKTEKEKLAVKMKLEKQVIKAEIDAEVMERKILALKKRYGYLYKDNENFVASKKYNKFRELENWWSSTSTTFRKVVTGTLKFILWGTLAFLVIYFGYQGVKWLMENYQSLPVQ